MMAIEVVLSGYSLRKPLCGARIFRSPDGDGGAYPNEAMEGGGVPVGESDAAVASGAAYGIRDGAAVDAYSGAVQAGPEDADGVVGAGGRLCKSSVRSPRFRTP